MCSVSARPKPPGGTSERIIFMQERVKNLKGYRLNNLDGEMGKVKEFYFDDHHWTIRYLVADTGNWLSDRQVLISPYSLSSMNKEERTISVDLTEKKIEESPTLGNDEPISRLFEQSYFRYYQLPMYWGGAHMWGAYPFFMRDTEIRPEPVPGENVRDYHLRSTHPITGYHLQAVNGEIGHVEDFILDDKNWAIRYLVIDTANWWPGKRVLISPNWIECVGWDESKVFVNLSREMIKQAPEYTETSLLTHDYEKALHAHYNRPGYWVGELAAKRNSLAAPSQNRDSRLAHEIHH
jgi:hypothetical protein